MRVGSIKPAFIPRVKAACFVAIKRKDLYLLEKTFSQ
jgi:hypothetical protein